MLLAIPAIVIGLVLLTKAADEFVAGAARLSAALRVPPVVIGAVVVGFGTSAPEMVVSAVAASDGKLDIAVGNIIGSNIANLTLVLGVAGLICTLKTDSAVLKREAPLSFGAVVIFAVLVQGGLQRWEGAVLLVGLFGALAFIFLGSRDGNDELAAEVDEFLDDDEGISTVKESLRTLFGLIFVVIGAQLTVYGATEVAEELGLGEGFVGLTLIAIGTSLPELVTAIAAARKGEDQLIIGNLLGSNVFNSFAVGATAAFFGPGQLEDGNLAGLATIVMVGVAGGACIFMFTGRKIVRWEALVLLAVYVTTIPLLAA